MFTFSKPNERQAPGRLTAETRTPWPMETVPGASSVSSPSRTTLSEPSARQGDIPAGQELSKLWGSLTSMTMLWSKPSASVVTIDRPVWTGTHHEAKRECLSNGAEYNLVCAWPTGKTNELMLLQCHSGQTQFGARDAHEVSLLNKAQQNGALLLRTNVFCPTRLPRTAV